MISLVRLIFLLKIHFFLKKHFWFVQILAMSGSVSRLRRIVNPNQERSIIYLYIQLPSNLKIKWEMTCGMTKTGSLKDKESPSGIKVVAGPSSTVLIKSGSSAPLPTKRLFLASLSPSPAKLFSGS